MTVRSGRRRRDSGRLVIPAFVRSMAFCASTIAMIGYLLQGKTFSRVSSITKP